MLHDLPDSLGRTAEHVVLDEGPTNLREVVDAAIAHVAPLATRRTLSLRAMIDSRTAHSVLSDALQLRQMLVFLLSYVIRFATRHEVALVVAVERLDVASQTVSFVAMESGNIASGVACSRRSSSGDIEPRLFIPICEILAQRMKGEVAFTHNLNEPVRANFTAPFTLEAFSNGRLTSLTLPSQSSTARIALETASPSSEPYERRHLDALSAEGVDLESFLGAWRQAMNDDLQRLDALSQESHDPELKKLLHRLSGAVGLVGAHSLTEAFRQASASTQHRCIESIRALAERARNLVTQLELAAKPYRSK